MHQKQWKHIQSSLKNKVVIPETNKLMEILKTCPYIVGLDISYLKNDTSHAVCTAVLLNYHDITSSPIDTETREVQIIHPYQAGFLAFRELDSYILVFQCLMARHMDIYDKIGFVMLDGNGILHPNGLGLTSHFGVITNLRTIGCGKKLHQIDGMDHKVIRAELDNLRVNEHELIGTSGTVYGWAMRRQGVLNPVYISPGHLVSIRDSLEVTRALMIHREPEPIRQADRLSREYIRLRL